MKTFHVPGEFAFRALIKTNLGWFLSDGMFFNYKEVMETYKNHPDVIWPVEVLDNGAIYVPAQEELE